MPKVHPDAAVQALHFFRGDLEGRYGYHERARVQKSYSAPQAGKSNFHVEEANTTAKTEQR
jgi:hypothetical protein